MTILFVKFRSKLNRRRKGKNKNEPVTNRFALRTARCGRSKANSTLVLGVVTVLIGGLSLHHGGFMRDHFEQPRNLLFPRRRIPQLMPDYQKNNQQRHQKDAVETQKSRNQHFLFKILFYSTLFSRRRGSVLNRENLG